MMHSRRISLCLFSIAVAQGSITESIDNSASGFVEPPDLLNSNDPTFDSDTLNLLVYNSEPVSNSDRLDGLTYSSETLNNLGNSPIGSETYSNGPFSNSDAPNSESPESSPSVVPDLNSPDLFQSDSPISSVPADKTESDGGLTSNPNHNLNLESLRGACISDNSAAILNKGSGGFCLMKPRTEYHKKQGHSGGTARNQIQRTAKQDTVWTAKQNSAGKYPQTTEHDQTQAECRSLGEFYETRLIAMCCLGPSHILAFQVEHEFSFYVSNEENCSYNWPERPICLDDEGHIDPDNAFCCEKPGAHTTWGLFMGLNCVPMNAMSEPVWN